MESRQLQAGALNRRSGLHLGCWGEWREARSQPGLTSAAPTPPVLRGAPQGQPTRRRRAASAPCRPAGELQPGPPASSRLHSVVPTGAAEPTSGPPAKLPLQISPSCTTEHNLPRPRPVTQRGGGGLGQEAEPGLKPNVPEVSI